MLAIPGDPWIGFRDGGISEAVKPIALPRGTVGGSGTETLAAAPHDVPDDDADILALQREGKAAAAFDLLAARYGARVYRLCHAFVRDAALAEDIAQDSFIRVWRALPAFDGRARLSSWIYAIARNRSLTALSRRRHTEVLSEEHVDGLADEGAQDGSSDDGHALLRHFVDALPEKQRVPLTLYYYEDRSVADVAAQLGIPEATVKTHLARGRARLLERLREAGLAEASLWILSTP